MSYGVDVHPYYQRGYGFDGPTPDFAWVKVADGSRPYRGVYDGVPWPPDVLVNRALARGVPVGGYLYGQPVSRSGVSFTASTAVLLAEVRRVGALGVVPALDIEDDANQHIWSAAEARDFCAQFVAECRRQGFARCGIYLNDAMAKKIGRDFLEGLGGDVVLWVARYAKDGVTKLRPVNVRYDVHQWTSAGGLDKNEAFNNRHLLGAGGIDDEDADMASDETREQIFEDTWYKAVSTVDGVTYNAATMLEGLFKLLPDLVEHVTHDPDVTADAVREWITAAVKDKINVTGSLVVEGK